MKKNINIFCSNKSLLIVLVLCIMALNGCEDTNLLKEDFSDTCQEIGTNAYDEQEKGPVYNKEISIQYANGELIREYLPSKIIDISSHRADEESILIMLSSKSTVKKLTIAELGWVQGNFELGDIIYEKYEMSPEEVLFIKMSIGDKMNFKSVSYINAEGTRTNMFLHKNETDGSLFIGEYYRYETLIED